MINTSRPCWLLSSPRVLALLPCLLASALVLPSLGLKRLWFDELYAANTIVGELYAPSALGTTPVGLAMLAGTLVRLTAPTEFWLRVVPFAFGLGTVFLVFLLSRDLYRSRLAGLLASVLFATNLTALTYFKELKHYTADMFFATLLVLLAERLAQCSRPARWAAYAAVLAVAPFFSFGSLFVAAMTSSVLLATMISRAQRRGLATWLAYHALPAVIIGLYFAVFLRAQQTDALVTAWSGGFPDSGPVAAISWYAAESARLLSYFFAPLPRLVGPGRLVTLFLMTAALLLGAWAAAAARRPRHLVLLIGPLVAAAGAAHLELYPFSASRVLLFALPGLVVLATGGMVVAYRAAWRLGGLRLAAVVLGLALLPVAQGLLIAIAQPSLNRAATPTEAVPEMIDVLRSQLEPGDLVYVYYGARLALQFYAPELAPERLGEAYDYREFREATAAGVHFVYGGRYTGAPQQYGTELGSLLDKHPAQRLWILIGHRRGAEEEALVSGVSECARQEFFQRRPGAALYRFRHTEGACPEASSQAGPRPTL